MAKFCQNCGREISDEAKLCIVCGTIQSEKSNHKKQFTSSSIHEHYNITQKELKKIKVLATEVQFGDYLFGGLATRETFFVETPVLFNIMSYYLIFTTKGIIMTYRWLTFKDFVFIPYKNIEKIIRKKGGFISESNFKIIGVQKNKIEIILKRPPFSRRLQFIECFEKNTALLKNSAPNLIIESS